MLHSALAAALLTAGGFPALASGQSTGRNHFVIEATPIHGTVTYARGAPELWNFGIQAGFGFPQIDITLNSSDDEFTDIAHLAPVIQRRTRRTLLEIGARVGIAEFEACQASDCLPGVYLAPSVLFAIGSDRWKVGSSLTAGRLWEPGRDGANFANLSPLNLVIRLHW
jgi:hypothetical protein